LIRHPLTIAPIGAQRQALLTERLPDDSRQGRGSGDDKIDNVRNSDRIAPKSGVALRIHRRKPLLVVPAIAERRDCPLHAI
jgi:hypothetical protein